MNSNRSFWIGLVTLVFCSFGLRLAFCVERTGLGHALEHGYREYTIQARRLLATGTFACPFIEDENTDEPSALLPPLYTLLVGGAYYIFGVETFGATLMLQLINAAAASAVVGLVFLITRRLAGQAAALLAGMLATVHPLLITYTHLIWETNLSAFFLASTLWFAVVLSDRPLRFVPWLLYGGWLGVVALLNPALTATYPIFVLYPIVRSSGASVGPILFGASASVLGWALVIAPWTVRNYVQFDELMYVRNGLNLEIWLGVSPQADVDMATVYQEQFAFQNKEVQEHIGAIGERAYLAECGGLARQAIADDPGRYARLVARRAVDFWFGTISGRLPPSGGGLVRSLFRTGIVIALVGQMIVILLWLVWGRSSRRFGWWMMAAIVAYSIAYCMAQVQLRFVVPMTVIQVVLVAMALTDVWRSSRSQGIRPAKAARQR